MKKQSHILKETIQIISHAQGHTKYNKSRSWYIRVWYEEDDEQYTMMRDITSNTQDHNSEVSMFTLKTKEETIQTTIKVQDA